MVYEAAWFENKKWWTLDEEEDSFNETVTFEFDIGTWNNYTQEGYLEICIYNGSGYKEDYDVFWYNVTGNGTSGIYEWNWSAEYTDTYNFTVELWGYESEYLLHEQNHTIFLDVVYEAAWFENKTWWTVDVEDDSFNETASFEFDIGTWNNYTQEGYLDIYIADSYGFEVDSDSLWFNVTGNVSDAFTWNWSAEVTDTYTFDIILWSDYSEKLLHYQNHTIFLDVVYDAAWFEQKMDTHYDSEGDGFNETASFYFDIGTWPNYNQTGYLEVIIHDSYGFWVDNGSIWFDVNGNISDPIFWEWEAEWTDTYNFTIELWNEDEDLLLHRQNHTIFLDVVYDAAWFENKAWKTVDVESDGFNESVNFTFDVGTWKNYTQEGIFNICIYNSSYVEMDLYEFWFEATGNSSTDGLYWFNWTANYTDTYTIEISLFTDYEGEELHYQEHEIFIDVVYDAAWFETKDWSFYDWDENGTLEAVSFAFDIGTWPNYTQKGMVYVDVYNSTGMMLPTEGLAFNATGNTSANGIYWFNWSAEYNDVYFFDIWVYDLEYDTLHRQNHTFALDKSQEAWFADWDYSDEGPTKHVWYDIDTNRYDEMNLTVNVIIRTTDTEVEVGRYALNHTITGNETEELWFNWTTWLAETNFTFEFNLTDKDGREYDNFTIERNFLDFNVTISSKDYWDELDTKYVWFDIDTNLDRNRMLIVELTVNDSYGVTIFEGELFVNVTGSEFDTFWFNWTANLSDSYDVSLYVRSPALVDGPFQYQYYEQYLIVDNYLEVRPPAAWFESKTYRLSDVDGDGFNESINWTFDIGTWDDFSQEGYLFVEILNSTGSYIDVITEWFNVSGNTSANGLVQVNWSAATWPGYSDNYTFNVSLWSDMHREMDEFHNQTHHLELWIYDAPEASITLIDPNPAGEDEDIDFNGTGASPYGEIVAYRWWIDGEVVASGSYTGAAAAFGIAAGELAVGGHAVAFQVRDEFGSWSENDSAALIIKDTTPPRLGLLVEPDYDTGKIMIYLRADEALGTLKVELDDHGSRAVHLIAMTPDSLGDLRNYTGSHATVAAGNYTVTVTANDTAGNAATATSTARIQQVTVTPDKPVVVDNKDNANTTIEIHTKNETSGNISVSRTTAPAPNEAEAGLKELNIYVSIDIDDELLDELDYVNITIYYDPDELPEDQPEEGLKLYHFVESNQTWIVVNPHGVDNVSHCVWGHVHDFSVFGVFGANVAPTADAGPDIEAAVGEEVTFHGTAHDMDGTIVSYEWDFDDDGVWDASTAEATWTYNQSGRYLVKLRVTDDKGSTSFDTVLVEVGKKDEDGTTISPWVLLGVGAAIIAIAAVVIFLRRTQ